MKARCRNFRAMHLDMSTLRNAADVAVGKRDYVNTCINVVMCGTLTFKFEFSKEILQVENATCKISGAFRQAFVQKLPIYGHGSLHLPLTPYFLTKGPPLVANISKIDCTTFLATFTKSESFLLVALS